MDHVQLRNFKDFLLLYNQISETCFRRCANTFNSRDVEIDEERCVENCAHKHIHANHKIMQIYMEVQPIMVQKRIEEANKMQENLQKQSQDQEKVTENALPQT